MKSFFIWLVVGIFLLGVIGVIVYYETNLFVDDPEYSLAYMGSPAESVYWDRLNYELNDFASKKNIIFEDYTPYGHAQDIQQVLTERLIKNAHDALLWGVAGDNPDLTQLAMSDFMGTVFFIDYPVEGDYGGFVGLDNYASGQVVAKYMESEISSSDKVLIVAANMFHKTSYDRINGSRDYFDSVQIDYDFFDINSSTWEVDEKDLKEISDLILSENYSAVFIVWDTAAHELLEYFEMNDLKKDFILVGFDGLDFALKDISRGKMDATVVQPVDLIAESSFNQIDSYFENVSYEKDIYLSGELVTQENVGDYL